MAPNFEHHTLDVRIDVAGRARPCLSQSAWDTLINRISHLPARANTNAGLDSEILFEIGYFCGGVIDALSSDELKKIAPIVKRANNNAPFIAACPTANRTTFQSSAIDTANSPLRSSFLATGKTSR
ncbi:MAG: hypothetical protein M2R46_02064 [Verrucomicrobia subdivision 3 bacterium]|nr:hypothetical protein [Limisphaerales bacterium]